MQHDVTIIENGKVKDTTQIADPDAETKATLGRFDRKPAPADKVRRCV